MSVLRKLKSIFVSDHHNPIRLEAVETWMVRYQGRYGYTGMYTKPLVQAFTNKDDAKEFAKALQEAYALTGNEHDYHSVSIEKA